MKPLATQYNGGQFAELKLDKTKMQNFNVSDIEDYGNNTKSGKNGHNNSFIQNQNNNSSLTPVQLNSSLTLGQLQFGKS